MKKQTLFEELSQIKKMMNLINEEVTFDDYQQAVEKLGFFIPFIAHDEGVADEDDIEARLNHIRHIRKNIKMGDEKTLSLLWKMAGDREDLRNAINTIWFYTSNNPIEDGDQKSST